VVSCLECANVAQSPQWLPALIGASGVVVGTVIAGLLGILKEWWISRNKAKADKKRTLMLKTMLDRGSSQEEGWRKISTLARVIGQTEEATKDLLVLMDARASEICNDGEVRWSLISRNPLP
jgi:hypothetical protein